MEVIFLAARRLPVGALGAATPRGQGEAVIRLIGMALRTRSLIGMFVRPLPIRHAAEGRNSE